MTRQIVIFGSFPSCDFARRQSARRRCEGPDGNIMAPLTEATTGRRFTGHNSRPLPGITSKAILVEVHHHAIPTGFSTED
jgi:hypothetical protein